MNDNQAGFRESYSCELAIQTVMASWIDDLQKFKYIGAVFLDYRRAFETIDRTILIEKHKEIGIKGHVLDWFNSYLTERLQKVR